MQVNFYTDSYGPTNGVTTTIDDWAEGLEHEGQEFTIVSPDTEQRSNDVKLKNLVEGLWDEYNLAIPHSYFANRRAPEPDIVHTHTQFGVGLMGARRAREEEVPRIASHHTPIQHYADYLERDFLSDEINEKIKSIGKSLYREWEKIAYTDKLSSVYAPPDRITAPTQQAAQDLENRIDREVEVVSNGVDTDFFSPTESDLLEREGINEKPVVGFCGRIGYEKNLEDLAELSKRFEREVVVAGGGGAPEEIIPELEEAGVKYIGWLEDEEMPEFYSEIDILLQPSTVETQGKTVLEANSCGKPAIGADAKALEETVQEGINGEKYEPGNIDQLHEKIEEVLEGDYTPRTFVVENHSLEKVVDKLESIYREEISKPT